MPCIVDITSDEMANHWETLLCKACKYLTKEQIDLLRNPGSGILDGLDWYTQHLLGDYSSSQTSQDEKNCAKKELHRLGYMIKENPGSWQLRELTE